jgi:hypothetical protein
MRKGTPLRWWECNCALIAWVTDQNGQAPFNNGTRQSYSQPTTCSPADSTCGTGIRNPSVQSPVQKRELNVAPQ